MIAKIAERPSADQPSVASVAHSVSGTVVIAAYDANAPSEARVRVAFTPTNIVQAIFNEPREGSPAPAAGDLERIEVLTGLAPRVGLPLDEVGDHLRVEQTGAG